MEVTRHLVHQVSKACPKHGTELDVVTKISLPLWQRFNRELGHPANTKPTDWIWPKQVHRVFGSETIIVRSKRLFAMSAARSNPRVVFCTEFLP